MELPILTPPPLREDLMGYGKVAAEGRGYVAGQIEVTSRCFQSCTGCDSWREDVAGVQRGEWDIAELQRVVAQLVEEQPHVRFEHLTLTGGDPQAWKPLRTFLEWWRWARRERAGDWPTLGLNTALTQDLDEAENDLWRDAVDDLRISLDGVDEGHYNAIRGTRVPSGSTTATGAPKYKKGVATTPKDVLRRMCWLRHPGLTTNTTVFNQNVSHVPAILSRLDQLRTQGVLKIRKAHFLAVIGDRGLLADQFWANWAQVREHAAGLALPSNFSENPAEVRAWLMTPAAREVKCYAGGITFHVKANGDVYPCCLVGGEALKTQPDFVLGNVRGLRDTMPEVQARYRARCDYADPNKPCREICQWKQLQINLAGHRMAANTLAMP